jgi:hypothetical protein
MSGTLFISLIALLSIKLLAIEFLVASTKKETYADQFYDNRLAARESYEKNTNVTLFHCLSTKEVTRGVRRSCYTHPDFLANVECP